MDVMVNRDTCVGCGLCADTCPEVFKMDGDVAVTVVREVPPSLTASCREAADACPVEAIELEE